MFKKFSLKKLIYTILGIATIGGGTTYYVNKIANVPDTQSVKVKIEISTKDSKPLTFSVGSNLVDVGFLGSASKCKVRDLTDTTFLRLNRNLGFSRGVYPSYGSIAQYVHTLPAGTEVGYNMKESDFASHQDYINYGNGVAWQAWGVGFSNTNSQFGRTLPIVCDVVLNPQHGTWKECKAAIDRFNPEYAAIGCESVTGTMTPDQYKAIATSWNDSINKYYPKVKVVADGGLVYKNSPKNSDWNRMIATLNIPLIRQYYQVGDRVAFNRNQDSNLIKVCYYYDTLCPIDMKNFISLFTNKYIVGGEFMNEDNRGNEQYINEMPVGNYCLGRMYQMFIENQGMINAAYWMALKNLIASDNSIDKNYTTLSILNTLIAPNRNVSTLTITGYDGVTGIAISDGNQNYVLLNNKSATSYFIPNFVVNGTTTSAKKVIFNVQTQYAKDLYSDVLYTSSSATGGFTVPQYSINVISFTIK